MKGQICVMDSSGDRRTSWDTADPASVNAAETLFNNLRQHGHILFSAGSEPSHMQTFDPTASEIIAAPRIVGG